MCGQNLMTDRFGREYTYSSRVVYPTRRGANMDLVTGTIYGAVTRNGKSSLRIQREDTGKIVNVFNLNDVVVVP